MQQPLVVLVASYESLQPCEFQRPTPLRLDTDHDEHDLLSEVSRALDAL